MVRVAQVSAPTLPGVTGVAAAVDGVNQSLYNALAADPIVGTLARAIPPPPKISALFGGQAEQARPAVPRFPFLPVPPFPGARQGIAAPGAPGGRTGRQVFS